MLKFFRDQKNSWLVKGILILTALSFISLFGSNRFLTKIPDEGKAVAELKGQKITVAQYIDEFDHQVRSMSRILQKPFNVQDALESGMLFSLFSQMISQAVMQSAVDDLHLAVSDEAVRQAISNMPVFTDYDGSFSLKAYKEYLSDMGMTENRFIHDTFLDLKAQQLTGAAQTVSIQPAKLVETKYSLKNEKRTADVFSIKPEDLKITQKPSKEEKEQIYKTLSDQLMAPEYRTFTVLHLTLEDVAKKIKISDEELLEIYNENKDSYAIEEIRDIDQMLFTTKEEADKAYNALQDGQDFMDVAKKFANQTEEQTKLGELTPSTATGDWSEVVFAAKKGDFVGPVQTAFGWQILRVNKITPRVEKQFNEVRDEIEQKMIDTMAYDTLSETVVALDDRFGAGETIEEIAKSTGYPVKTYTLVDPSGKNENNQAVSVSKTVLATAFVSDPGRESPMIEDGSDYFVLRVDDIREPALRPIEKAQKEINEAWKIQKQKEKAEQISKKIKEELEKGASVATVSKKTGIAHKRIKDLTRYGNQLPPGATYQLFNKPTTEIITVSDPAEYLVIKTVDITPADPEKDKLGITELRRLMQEQTANEKSDALLSDFASYLNLKVYENTAQKAFSYLTKTIQDNETDY